MKQERLDKILSDSGRFSRSEARALIVSGQVTVNGTPVRRPETKISREAQVVAKGEAVDTAEFVYYMMNKPAGFISAAKDEKYPAVTKLLPKHLQGRGLFPVGRLDVDVTGLLILTDDGGYAHRVTSPKSAVPKTYEVFVDGALTEEHVSLLAGGVTLQSGTVYKSAALVLFPEDASRALVTVTEGKFHEVKNLMAVCGCPVLRMQRVSIGGIQLDRTLAPGEIRSLTAEEIALSFAENV